MASAAENTGERDIARELDLVLEKAMRETSARAIVAARLDGLPIAARVSTKMDSRVVAAVAATIYGAAEVVCTELAQGAIEQIVLQCAWGRVIATGAGPEAVLFAVYPKEANLGFALLSLTRAGSEITTILEGF